MLKPQVTIQTVQIRSSQVSILGQVAKPGRYPIEIVGSKVSEMIAAAGGVLPGGADVVTLVGNRNGKPIKLDIDLPAILQAGQADLDVVVENGDIIYVDRAPTFYMYGEVQRPGQLRLERNMTLMQALAEAGGLTARGTERGIKVHRKDAPRRRQDLRAEDERPSRARRRDLRSRIDLLRGRSVPKPIPSDHLGAQVARAGAVHRDRRGRHRHHDVPAAPVHGRDVAGRRDAHRSGARRARAGAGGAELHGHADRDPEERAGGLARRQAAWRRAFCGGRRAVARSDQREDPARALLRRRPRARPLGRAFARQQRHQPDLLRRPIRSSRRPPPMPSRRPTWTSRSSCASRRRASRRASSTTRPRRLRANLEQAQAKLSKFQQIKGIVVTDERLDQENARYGTLISQLATAQAERVETSTLGSATRAASSRPTCCRAAPFRA